MERGVEHQEQLRELLCFGARSFNFTLQTALFYYPCFMDGEMKILITKNHAGRRQETESPFQEK